METSSSMSSKVRRDMHINSLLAYYEGEADKFSGREFKVLAAIETLRRASDREVMHALGFTDMNSVRPRITELIAEGLIEEVGSQEDPETKKAVRVVALAKDPRKAQRQFSFAISS